MTSLQQKKLNSFINLVNDSRLKFNLTYTQNKKQYFKQIQYSDSGRDRVIQITFFNEFRLQMIRQNLEQPKANYAKITSPNF